MIMQIYEIILKSSLNKDFLNELNELLKIFGGERHEKKII